MLRAHPLASAETADGLCVEFFTSSEAKPGQNSSVINYVLGLNLLLLADTLRSGCVSVLVFTAQLGIVKPQPTVSLSPLETAGITESLVMGPYLLSMLCSEAESLYYFLHIGQKCILL